MGQTGRKLHQFVQLVVAIIGSLFSQYMLYEEEIIGTLHPIAQRVAFAPNPFIHHSFSFDVAKVTKIADYTR